MSVTGGGGASGLAPACFCLVQTQHLCGDWTFGPGPELAPGHCCISEVQLLVGCLLPHPGSGATALQPGPGSAATRVPGTDAHRGTMAGPQFYKLTGQTDANDGCFGPADKSREHSRAPCPPALMLHGETKSPAGDRPAKKSAFIAAFESHKWHFGLWSDLSATLLASGMPQCRVNILSSFAVTSSLLLSLLKGGSIDPSDRRRQSGQRHKTRGLHPGARIPLVRCPEAGSGGKEPCLIQHLLVVTREKCILRRCVVWTGDDRVFFFNPTMQLSVWEKPMDLRNRGDLNRIIEDPPHKRKLEAATSN
ncbi:hypothetical protein EI555_006770 [Monodon monoceros]|uniref:Transcription elongation regulator 1-like third WW domain-containing protein n=1 Tax=Monodon monoceros TaxID=40151 RepID=A0A4V5PAT1_MONMO|nr:hypothetical protein EI555_006770 [Monodon monoceros]